MRILHITAGVGKAAFGVAPVVMGLTREQQKLGHYVEIWHTDSAENELWAAGYSGLDITTFRRFETVGPKLLCWSPDMEKCAASLDGALFDILHHHGLWLGLSKATNVWRKTHRKPTMVAPHGMLEPWALGQSRWKKRLAYYLFEKANLTRASCLHACSELEAESIRKFGLPNLISIIPNGVDESWISNTGDARAFRSTYGISENRKVLLFLSRVAPKKGLPMLFEAMNMCKSELSEWCLVVAGNGSQVYIGSLKDKVRELSLDGAILFVGEIHGEMKRNAFAAASVFVLPTYSENFGIAVAEALGAGVPAITTTGTPWHQLEEHSCGWCVTPEQDYVADALRQATSLSALELDEMGRRGRELIRSKYTWERCGVVSVDSYSRLLEQGVRYESVLET